MTLKAVAGGSIAGTGGSLGAGGYTDNSGTPGNTTINKPSGRASFAAAASTCVVTCSVCLATSKVFVQLLTADATLTALAGVPATIAAGSFTVTGNAAATTGGAAAFEFLVVN